MRGGLTKSCKCGPAKWSKCGHPWMLSFYKKTCGCPTPTCPSDVRKAHARMNRVRVSLHKVASKPLTYEMSKTEAEGWADKLREQIREGTYGAKPSEPDAAPETALTFGAVADLYFADYASAPGRREGPIAAKANYLRIIKGAEIGGAKFGDKPIAEIGRADVEAVREFRRAQLRAIVERRARAIAEGEKVGRIVLPGERGGEVGVEHMMATLRRVFAWAVKHDHVERTPFKKDGLAVIDVRTVKKVSRRRRLDRESNEEERLLKGAVPEGEYGLGGRAPGMASHLRDLIVAALESGCRKGELLSLQWWQIKTKGGKAYRLVLPADKTKTSDPREVPITSRLRAILDYRRTGPDGRDHAPDAYVFGNEAGEQIGNVKTAWRAACRRARIAKLNFHDLRHEFISRLMEAGVPLHKVRDWAGHKNIATTGIYANTTAAHLDDALTRFEAREIDRKLTDADAAP